MPSIELHVLRPVPPALLASEMRKTLHAIESQTPPYEGFAITADLSSLHLPKAGLLSVPISVRLERTQDPAPQRIDFGFYATDRSTLFPTFEGSLRCDPDGPAYSTVWLVGEYTPPLGYVGKILDRTVLDHLAVQTLTPFLEALADAGASEVQRHERDAIRAARLNH